MPRRLLAINAVDQPGGAEIGLLRLAAGLRGRGWQVTLTTPGRGALQAAAEAAGHRWSPLALGGLGRGQGAPALGSWARAAALSRHAEVVLLNGGVAGRLLPAVGLPRPGRPRIVLHVHDLVERVPPFWRLADALLADSAAVAARLRGLDPYVVYCPVEADPPTADPAWAPGEGPVVGFVGRLEPRKGPLELIRAAPAIRARHPSAQVVLIGDDPYASDPAYTASVLAAADVVHVPWSENAPGLMRHLDVLVVPSRREPFGTVAAEALAVGTPVVASAVDGLREVVRDGVCGRLVAPGDVDALAQGVLEVLADRPRFAAAAPACAEPFLAERYVARVEALLGP